MKATTPDGLLVSSWSSLFLDYSQVQCLHLAVKKRWSCHPLYYRIYSTSNDTRLSALLWPHHHPKKIKVEYVVRIWNHIPRRVLSVKYGYNSRGRSKKVWVDCERKNICIRKLVNFQNSDSSTKSNKLLRIYLYRYLHKN